MTAPRFISLALPTPLFKTFDYILSDKLDNRGSETLVGSRVSVRFANQTLIGIILEVKAQSDHPIEKLKQAEEILDDKPLFNDSELAFLSWVSEYYIYPIGEVILGAMPVALRKGKPSELIPTKTFSLTAIGKEPDPALLTRAPKQAATLDKLQSRYTWPLEELSSLGVNQTELKPLITKGLLHPQESIPKPSNESPLLLEAPLKLNQEQQKTLQQIPSEGFETHLIFGETGSGKTEVYLQAIERTLEQGLQTLVLVPEIGLTTQTIQRFNKRFNRRLVTIHSNLNETERSQAWLMAKEGVADIILGTRSAVFTPIPKLGLIVIDEEHDNSFKQQDGLRYHARDLAAVRANQQQIPLILGSATPSLETLQNVHSKRYRMSKLSQRAGTAVQPDFYPLDLRAKALSEGFAEEATEAIQKTISAGEQALVFINRRGYSPTLLCHHCGWQAFCPRCDHRLTVHHTPAHLHCHHCDFQTPITTECPNCHSRELKPIGIGSERTEKFLKESFPNTPVIRIDRDSTRNKNSFEKALEPVHKGTPCILVGTQMLAKGHHFPKVTLVVILDADNGLFSTDFRGIERFGQLMLQVAGRAGREDKKGKVLIQTHLSDHPLLDVLINDGYSAFARQLYKDRHLANLPPFSHMALLRAESKRADNAEELLSKARNFLDNISRNIKPTAGHKQAQAENAAQPFQLPVVQLLGPFPAALEKRNERYRFQLQIICEQRPIRQWLCQQLVQYFENLSLSKRVRWSLDIDPQEVI